jgi:hypothetical protein
MEVSLSCIEEGFHCHRKASFKLEPPKENIEEKCQERAGGER